MQNNKIWKTEYDALLKASIDVQKKAYSPYSKFKVGAALLTCDGKIFTGCNIENASYPVGLCAERTAFSKAISEGYKDFSALLITGAKENKNGSDFCSPCGMCRQFIREFCPDDFPIILVKTDENGNKSDFKIYTLNELLFDSFGPDNLF